VLIEVAVSTLKDAQTAQAAGADRLELSAALEVGGLTPSLGTFLAIRQQVALPVVALLRPRPGGFVYDEGEVLTMRRDAEGFVEQGAEGLAFGFLTTGRQIDAVRTAEFVRVSAGGQHVFHRAFDLTADPFAALETLIDMGVTRVLTSGQRRTAMEGAPLLGRLIERAAGRIEVLPAAGITPENAAALLGRTGATQVHGTFAELVHDPAEPVDGGRYRVTSGRRVKLLRDAL
jgi:copper homeostasis protein